MEKLPIRFALAVLAACVLSTTASAHQPDGAPSDGTVADQSGSGPEVLERDAEGRATKVRLEGRVYYVCTPGRTDRCINPRDAGLDQGNREIKYWPGKPASQIDEPLPVERPQAQADE